MIAILGPLRQFSNQSRSLGKFAAMWCLLASHEEAASPLGSLNIAFVWSEGAPNALSEIQQGMADVLAADNQA